MFMKESISLTWRRIPERYRLEGSKCLTCGTVYFPKREVCPKCRSKGKLENFKFSGKGKIYSFTKVYVPPKGFEDQVPYYLAIVELEEGARLTAQIIDSDPDKIKIGAPVEMVFRIIQMEDPEGLIHYGFKFKVVE